MYDKVSCDDAYLPFITSGYVSLTGHGEKVPVTILSDTGALGEESDDTGDSALVVGMGLSVVSDPMHRLFSDFVQGEVCIAVSGIAGGRSLSNSWEWASWWTCVARCSSTSSC